MKIRTQKARGLTILKKSPVWEDNTPDHIIIQDKKDLKSPDIDLPVFARPCPTVPRHGFVDSRQVTTKVALKKLLKEAQDVDPNAELILMDKVSCEASAVLTPSQVTIGPSNDGATQGKNCITLPLAHLQRNKKDEKSAGITQAPYFEVLFDKSYSYDTEAAIKSVQLRDGPATKVVGNYIPKNITISKVINVKNHTDLLKWETLMQNCTEGTVVYHPKGSAVSHYSVHAVINKIPVIFDYRPKVGDVLVKNTGRQVRHYQDVLRGIAQGLNTKMNYDDTDEALNIGVFGAHHATALIGSKEGAHLLGVGAASLLRLGMAACLGEAGYDGNISNKYSLLGEDYKKSLSKLKECRKLMPVAFYSFYLGGLANGKNCGFGGDAWGGCTGSTIRLDRKIYEFDKNPCDKTFADLIGELHIIVNIAHNNGNFLNKFESGFVENLFDQAAEAEPKVILRCALSYYRWMKIYKSVGPLKISTTLKPYKVKDGKINQKPVTAYLCKSMEHYWQPRDGYFVVVNTGHFDDVAKSVSLKTAKEIIKTKPSTKMLHGVDYDEFRDEKKKGYCLTPSLIKKLPKTTRNWIKKRLKSKKKDKTIDYWINKEKL